MCVNLVPGTICIHKAVLYANRESEIHILILAFHFLTILKVHVALKRTHQLETEIRENLKGHFYKSDGL